MRKWPVHDAKARFSELLDATLDEGPQIVTKRGVDTAVLVPMDTWRQTRASALPTLKELLLGDAARATLPVPPRGARRRRRPRAMA